MGFTAIDFILLRQFNWKSWMELFIKKDIY